MVRRREGLTLPSSSSSPSFPEALRDVRAVTPLASQKPKPRLSKQLVRNQDSPRDVAWEKRRREMLKIQEKKQKGVSQNDDPEDVTDEDLRELKGSIELGFGFKEEAGQKLSNTLPALDFYFAVHRHLSPLPSPSSSRISNVGDGSLSSASASSISIPCSPKTDSDSLKILSPGDNPQQVKQRLRHWAQAVACSVMQSH